MRPIQTYLQKTGVMLVLLLLPVLGQAQVVLDQDPLISGTVGLQGETFSNASISSSAGGVAYSDNTIGSDGAYSIHAGSDAPILLRFSMFNFQDTPNAYLSTEIKNLPAMAKETTATMDFIFAAGRISATVSVIGGSLNSLHVTTYASDADADQIFKGDVNLSAAPFVAVLPVPAMPGTRVMATASVTSTDGTCTASIPLSPQIVDIAANVDNPVEWTVDLTADECNTGTLTGSFTTTDLTVLGYSLNYKRMSVRGPDVRTLFLQNGETSYLFENLSVGLYSSYPGVLLNSPNKTRGYEFLQVVQTYDDIVQGEITTRDYDVALGVSYGTVKLNGAWDFNDLKAAEIGAGGGGVSITDQDVGYNDGAFEFVTGVGENWIWRADFRDSTYNPDLGKYSGWQVRNWFSGAAIKRFNVDEGVKTDAGVLSLATSQSLQFFALAQLEGQPEKQFTYMNLYGTGGKKSASGQWLNRTAINVYEYTVATPSILLPVRGLPGTYPMVAKAIGTDGATYSTTFELTLGEPVGTPEGVDIGQNFSDEGGNTIATVTFDQVDTGGETSVSKTTLGPGPSDWNYVVYTAGIQPQFYDIHTTALYSGEVQVCLYYDDSSLANPDAEERIRLYHYSASSGWEVITSPGYPDTENNIVCGVTSSFSLFALFELDPDAAANIDADGDGIDDDVDNCPATANPEQADWDGDGNGDACDSDTDGDGIPDDTDLCPNLNSANNFDLDGDGVGDPCDSDKDGDGVDNDVDNCPVYANAGQEDYDGDGDGDQCDTDDDGDAVLDVGDLCQGTTLGATIDDYGCSSRQRVELACPVFGVYKNHGQYVSCVAQEASYQVELGMIDEQVKGAIVSTAARSEVSAIE